MIPGLNTTNPARQPRSTLMTLLRGLTHGPSGLPGGPSQAAPPFNASPVMARLRTLTANVPRTPTGPDLQPSLTRLSPLAPKAPSPQQGPLLRAIAHVRSRGY